MGAPIIGRTTCPECGFGGAHVKKSEKCTFRYCPECGSQHHARTARQLADLVAKTRPEGEPAPASSAPAKGSPTPSDSPAVPPPALPTPTEGTATPPPAPTPAPARKRVGLFTLGGA